MTKQQENVINKLRDTWREFNGLPLIENHSPSCNLNRLHISVCSCDYYARVAKHNTLWLELKDLLNAL